METILNEISCVCRFCLCEGENVLMPVCNILDPSKLTVEAIEQSTGVRMVEENRIPYSICEDCYNKLKLCTSFRTCCLSNDVRFRELFADVLDSKSQVIPSDGVIEQREVKDHVGCMATDKGATFESNILEVEFVELNDVVPTDRSTHWEKPSAMEESLEKVEEEGNHSIPENSESKILLQKEEAVGRENEEPERDSLAIEHVDSNDESRLKSTGNISGSKDGGKRQLSNRSHKKIASNSVHSQKQLCPMCGKMVLDLADHMLSHTKERKHVCRYCSMAYARKTYLKLHVDTVHLKKVFKTCEICTRDFTHRTGYEAHMRAQHNIGRWYECKPCNMVFRHPGGLREHNNRKHNDKANCSCPVCGMEFQSNVGLKNHSKVHSSEKSTCKYCPKRFKSDTSRKRHEQTHFGITFPCTVCTKTYRYSQNLVSHMRKHRDSK